MGIIGIVIFILSFSCYMGGYFHCKYHSCPGTLKIKRDYTGNISGWELKLNERPENYDYAYVKIEDDISGEILETINEED